MKRLVALLISALLLSTAAPALAGGEPVSVAPNPVKQGKKVAVTAYNCESGPDWEAFVEIVILDEDGHVVYESYTPADDDGTTVNKIKMKKKRYPTGVYTIIVTCVHEFDEGGEGIWYSWEGDLTVKKNKKG